MMEICSNPEEQEHFSLTERRNAADIIREVGFRHRQETNEWSFHKDGGQAPTSPTPGVSTSAVARDPLVPSTHDLGLTLTMTNAPYSGSVHRQELSALLGEKLPLRAACSNSEEQKHFSMKTCRSVVDIIREARFRHRQ